MLTTALPMETPSRIWREIEEAEGEHSDMSLPPPPSVGSETEADITADFRLSTRSNRNKAPTPRKDHPVSVNDASALTPQKDVSASEMTESVPSPELGLGNSRVSSSRQSTPWLESTQSTLKADLGKENITPAPTKRPLAVRSNNNLNGPSPTTFETPKPATPNSDLQRRKEHLLSTLHMASVNSRPRTKLKQGTPHPIRRIATSPPASALLVPDSETSDGSSPDLTVGPNARANTSLPLDDQQNRFNSGKLNAYLHNLNTHLTEENTNLNQKIDDITEENKNLLARLEENNKVTEKVTDDENMQNRVRELDNENRKLKQQLEHTNEEWNEKLAKVREDARTGAENHDTETQRLQTEIYEAQDNLRIAEEESEKMRQELDDMKNQNREMKSQLELVQQENKQFKENETELQAQVENSLAIDGRSDANKSVRFEQIQGLQTPKTPGAFARNASYAADVSGVGNATISPLLDRIRILGEENEELRSRLGELNKDLDDKLNVLSDDKEKEALKSDLGSARNEQKRLQQELDALQESPPVREDESGNKSVRFERVLGVRTPKTPGNFKFNLSSAGNNSSVGDATISPLLDQIQRLQEENDDLRRRLEKLNEDVDKKLQDIMDQRDRNQRNEEENRDLKMKIATLMKHKDELPEKNYEEVRRLREEAATLAEYREEKQQKEKENRHLRKEINSLQEALEDVKKNADELWTDLEEFRERDDGLQSESDQKKRKQSKSLLALIGCLQKEVTRESCFRADLVHQKEYLQMLNRQQKAVIVSAEHTLSRFGINCSFAWPESEPRSRFKVAATAVVALCRTRTLASKWKRTRTIKESIREAYASTRGQPLR